MENSPRRHREVIYHGVINGKAFKHNSVVFLSCLNYEPCFE